MSTENLKERFIEALKTGAQFVLHHCSMCNYPCCFFSQDGKLFYDAGCYCVRYSGVEERDWKSLDFYLDATHGHTATIEKFISGCALPSSGEEKKP